MGFSEYHDVDVMLLHVVDDSVEFACFSESCHVPLAYSELVALGGFDVMVGLVVCCWVSNVSLKPV